MNHSGLTRSLRRLVSPAIRVVLAAAFVVVFSAAAARAEFVNTGVNVFQDAGGRLKVITTEKGLLVLYTQPIPLQNFDPTTIRKDGKEFSAFLWYDAPSRRYTELWVEKRAYRIEGNFNLRFGKYGRLAVDNTNPYASVVVNAGAVQRPDGTEKRFRSSVLGFLGNVPIVNQSGREAVAVFEADQMNLTGILEPYVLGKTGVFVDGREVQNDRLGALPDLSKRAHPCLERNVPKITEEELDEIRTLRTAADRVAALTRTLERCKKSDPLGGKLILRTSRTPELDGVIVFDPTGSSLKLVRELGSHTDKKQKICAIQPIRLGAGDDPEPPPSLISE